MKNSAVPPALDPHAHTRRWKRRAIFNCLSETKRRDETGYGVSGNVPKNFVSCPAASLNGTSLGVGLTQLLSRNCSVGGNVRPHPGLLPQGEGEGYAVNSRLTK